MTVASSGHGEKLGAERIQWVIGLREVRDWNNMMRMKSEYHMYL